MPRPATLPGIWGALAAPLGVSGLAEALGTNTRTLNNWANNRTPTPAIEAGLLAQLCEEHGIRPMLYLHPGLPAGYVASTPEGWVMWTWGLGAYRRRTRYRGHLEGLEPAGPADTAMARTHGWPW